MSAARDRIPPMAPDNQPGGARPTRRRPPDDPAPQAGRDLSLVPDTSDSASRLASLLAGSDNPDTPDEALAGSSSRDPLIDALTAPPPPPVDPDLVLIALGIRVPQYMATALRTLSFLRHRRQQELVVEALRQYLPPELLDKCRRSHSATQPGRLP